VLAVRKKLILIWRALVFWLTKLADWFILGSYADRPRGLLLYVALKKAKKRLISVRRIDLIMQFN